MTTVTIFHLDSNNLTDGFNTDLDFSALRSGVSNG